MGIVRLILLAVLITCGASYGMYDVRAQDAIIRPAGTGEDVQPAGTGEPETVEIVSPEDTGTDGTGTDTDGDFSIYVPDKMIANTPYEGLLLLREPREQDTAVSLATDKNLLDIPGIVTIPAGDNHAIFPIVPQSPADGEVTIHAISPEHTVQDTSMIYSVATQPTALLISAPTGDDSITVSASDVPIRIFLIDNHGIPIPAERDIGLTLTSSNAAVKFNVAGTLLDTVPLKLAAGTYSAGITARISGDGTIYAASAGLESDSLEVSYDDESPEVRLGVAPDPALGGSIIQYYVWLEQDGSIFIPDEVLDVHLTTSDPAKVRFVPYHLEHGNPVHHAYLTDGILRGELYAVLPSEDSSDEISVTASIPGYGSATDEIIVLPARPDSERPTADALRLWVYPDTPHDTAWAVVGTYSQRNQTGDDQGDYSDEYFPIVPTGHTLSLSTTDGIIHEGDITLDGSSREHDSGSFVFSAVSIPLEITSVSSHMISAHSDRMEEDTITFDSNHVYGYGQQLVVTPLPANLGRYGEIAYVSVTDGSGIITDVGGILDTDESNIVQIGDSLANVTLSDTWVGGTNTIYGMHLKEGGRVFVQIPGIDSEATTLETSGTKTGIEVWTPPRVGASEEFPVAIHAVDTHGTPVALITDIGSLSISSEQIMPVLAEHAVRFVIPREGTVQLNIISDNRHLGQNSIESFENVLASQVSIRTQTPDTVRLGTDIILDIFAGALQNPDIDIQGLDFAPDVQGRYVATPEEPGDYSVTVVIREPGWEGYSRTLDFTVEELIDITFNSIADDGVSVPAIIYLTEGISNKTHDVKNGLYYTIKPGVYELEVPQTIHLGEARMYGMDAMNVNGEPVQHAERFTIHLTRDSTITNTYYRQIDIDFEEFFDSDEAISGITGNDNYRYGDTVRLNILPQYELFGLIWHVPSSWHGLPDDARVSPDKLSVRFTADESASGSVEYEKTYVVMILIIAVGVTGPLVYVWRKSPDTLWNMSDYISGMRARMAKPKPRPAPASGDDPAKEQKKSRFNLKFKLPGGKK